MPTETSNSKEEHGVSLTSYQSPGQLLSYQPFIYLYMFVSNIYIPTPSPTNSQTFSVWLINLPAVDGSRQTGLKQKKKKQKTMVTSWKMHFRKGSFQSSGSVILGFFFFFLQGQKNQYFILKSVYMANNGSLKL